MTATFWPDDLVEQVADAIETAMCHQHCPPDPLINLAEVARAALESLPICDQVHVLHKGNDTEVEAYRQHLVDATLGGPR